MTATIKIAKTREPKPESVCNVQPQIGQETKCQRAGGVGRYYFLITQFTATGKETGQ
jgi:hypothetical protein